MAKNAPFIVKILDVNYGFLT